MFSLKEILPFYPAPQRIFREFILREYLQYKILQIVFDMRGQADKLCFLGGTALRIIHGNQRFSEHIDFDNAGLTEEEFYDISECIKKKLEQEGYEIEMRTVMRNAFHCYIKFPALLFKEGLTGHHSEKILFNWTRSLNIMILRLPNTSSIDLMCLLKFRLLHSIFC